VILPKPDKPFQVSDWRSSTETFNTAGIIEFQQGMIQQCVERTILAGKIAVKGFSGNIQSVTQI
jgi:hypothetical protein